MTLILRDMAFTFVMLLMLLFFFYSTISADFMIERMSFEI